MPIIVIRFLELGEVGVQYLDGLEKKQRNSKHQALQVLGLLHAYHKSDLLRAMRRAVDYHAYGFAALERILAHQATPKPGWQQLDESSQEVLARLSENEPIGSRHSQEYQHLLDGISPAEGNPDDETDQANSDTRSNTPAFDPKTFTNAEDSAQ